MLVGRSAELRTVSRICAGARLGEAGVLAVLGEPGVGKTALLDWALAELGPDARILRAVGIETERDLAFAGLSQLLRPAVELIDQIPAPQSEALAAALALRPGRPRDRFAIGAATLSLISRYAEHGMTAVIVDDLHLLDRPSVEALVFAARRLHSEPVAVLFGGRTPDIGDAVDGLPRLELCGLAREPARQLIRRGRSTELAADRFVELYRRTAGNPLGLLELSVDPDGWRPEVPELPVTVPDAVTRAFARRIDQLAEPARSVLLVAAVAGRDLPLTWAACDRLELDPAELAESERAALVSIGGGMVTFRHPLLRAATYSGAAAGQRRRVHRAVAECLPEPDLERRAWHLAAAVWEPDAEIAGLLERAAHRALGRAGYAGASTAYQRSAELSPAPGDRCTRTLWAAQTAWAAGQPDRTISLLSELTGWNPDPDVELAGCELRAVVAARTGSLHEAQQMLVDAADRATTPDQQAVLLADAVHASFYLGDTTRLLILANRLTDLIPNVSSSRSLALGLVACGIARVVAGHGGIDEIRAAAPLLEAETELRTDPARLSWLMLPPLFLRYADGGVKLRALVDEVRGSAAVGSLPALLFHIARDQAATDVWDRATANYGEGARLARETGQTAELAAVLAGRCWLESRQGAEQACRADADEALQICAERDIRLFQAWVRFAVGDLELSLGHAEEAVQQLTRLTELLNRCGMGDPDLSPVPELVDALLRTGDRDRAQAWVPAYVEAADVKGQPWSRARSRRAIGLVARADEMDAAFADALDLHDEGLDGFEAARTRLAYGERLRRVGRRVDARAQLRESLTVFERLGAARWATRAATELTASGVTVQRSEVGWRLSLTPQELQVSLLLAEGRTTREAAAALFLSPKTIEYHLRKAYTKLGIHSREELAAAMAAAEPPARP